MALSVQSLAAKPTLAPSTGGEVPLAQYNPTTTGNAQQMTNLTLAAPYNPYIVNPADVPSNIIASGNYTGSASGASTNGTGAGNTADIAAYTDQIASLNNLLQNADTVQHNGEAGINRSFDRSGAQLQDGYNGQNQKYDQQEKDTTTGYQDNLNTINGQARTGYQSLQALLGGSGSAGEILAPMAVSNHAAGQTQGAAAGFGRNLEALATARADAGKQFKSAQDDLLAQKNSKLAALISSIDQQKANYQSQIGAAQNQLNIARGGNYATPTAQNNAIAALQADQNSLADRFQEPAFTPQNANYQAPNMAGYTAQAAQIGGLSNQPVNSSDPAAAMQAMLADQARKQNQNQYAI